ncbi:hypothetical protein TTHERM_000441737 (macronuclear) [Tetrahymena thermophila SB210]|uniref:Uncharacterized protein n=1 Tax=Tetrahymena thermophila (strain SB210) TaxID=312017 RepID=W7XHR3_TETTS|nr:hypothetical protein TTHERM_000441737 [Tetrahymena thermophila SB210]EWS73986.1 hypothetical protein TTHERM_000441737 [Tetrahymena thermophila SB210]|eukprot:XP_012653448.1 hypothetical protein TTHERM_000441737 [Tetrahymena thermophila SB210]
MHRECIFQQKLQTLLKDSTCSITLLMMFINKMLLKIYKKLMLLKSKYQTLTQISFVKNMDSKNALGQQKESKVDMIIRIKWTMPNISCFQIISSQKSKIIYISISNCVKLIKQDSNLTICSISYQREKKSLLLILCMFANSFKTTIKMYCKQSKDKKFYQSRSIQLLMSQQPLIIRNFNSIFNEKQYLKFPLSIIIICKCVQRKIVLIQLTKILHFNQYFLLIYFNTSQQNLYVLLT